MGVSKQFAELPLFVPENGYRIRAPLESKPGYWMGAPSALWDPDTRRFYLAYRVRRPYEQGRGVACRLAVSEDGIHFEDIGEVRKSDLDTPSIEKCELYRNESVWSLYLSTVDPETGRWRIQRRCAPQFSGLLHADQQELDIRGLPPHEGVKDPVVFGIGPMTAMLASVVLNDEHIPPVQLHARQDAFAIGLATYHTRLFLGEAGNVFHDQGPVLVPVPGSWKALAIAGTAVVRLGSWFAIFYSAKGQASEAYETRSGVALTADFGRVWDADRIAPRFASPHAPHGCRYIEVVQGPDAYYYYYEMTEASGAHGLYVARVLPAGSQRDVAGTAA